MGLFRLKQLWERLREQQRVSHARRLDPGSGALLRLLSVKFTPNPEFVSRLEARLRAEYPSAMDTRSTIPPQVRLKRVMLAFAPTLVVVAAILAILWSVGIVPRRHSARLAPTGTLGTHVPGIDEQFKTRQYQLDVDFTTAGVDLGYTYQYAKADEGCLEAAEAKVWSGNPSEYPSGTNAFTLSPPICASDEATITWSQWNGMTFYHAPAAGTVVHMVFSTQADGAGASIGWDDEYWDDSTTTAYCITCQ